MKQHAKLKALIMVILAVALLLPAGAVVMAAQADPSPSTARLYVNGAEAATSQGGNDPFLINGTTYLSIRALSIALGADMGWRPETSTVYVGEAPQAQTVLVTAAGISSVFAIDEILTIGEPEPFSTQVGDDFDGWTLAAVLGHLQVGASALAGAQYITFTAANGTVASIPASDALATDNGHLIFEDDRGAFRLVMAQASSRGSWVREIVEIGIDSLAVPGDISLVVNGRPIVPTDVQGNVVNPFVTGGGVVYLPLRAVATALGMEIGWDSALNAITLSDGSEVIEPAGVEPPAPDTADDMQIGDGEIAVTGTDGVVSNITTEDVMSLEARAVSATIRGNERNFTGVPLVDVLRLGNVNYTNGGTVIVRAVDGFNVVLTISEILDATNVHLAWLEDGEPVTTDVNTPFMLVVAHDTVPMRFARYVSEIDINALEEATDAPELGEYEFAIVAGGQTHIASMELIEALEPINFDSDGRGRYFTGVAFLDILEYFDIDFSSAAAVRFETVDGLTHEWTATEAFTPGNGFIAIAEGGEPLRERDYPFRSVLVGFPSNRWLGQLQIITLL